MSKMMLNHKKANSEPNSYEYKQAAVAIKQASHSVTEFASARIDKFDMVICLPAVLTIMFGSYTMIFLLPVLLCLMVALGRLIWKQLPKPPKLEIVATPTADYHLTAHAKMSQFQWDRIMKENRTDAAIWQKVREIYTLHDNYVKFTVDSWVDHINWNNEFQPASRRDKTDSPGEVYLYFYTAVSKPEPVIPPVVLEGDDARWARMFEENPRAYWLDPELWSKVGYTPADFTNLAIELQRQAHIRSFG